MTRKKLTHCKRGHPYDEENTHYYLDRKGYMRRVCRACAKLRNPFRERLYGLSREDYAELVADQNGVCAVCGRGSEDRALAVDHDHASGGIRGLLCAPCNTGLGVFRDDPDLLRKAIAYLGAHRRGQDAPQIQQPVISVADEAMISTAFDMAIDAFMSDIEQLAAGDGFAETFMWTNLPDAFIDHYDLRFAVRFLIGTQRVRDRFAEGFPFPATCVGEELALRAVMRMAITIAADTGDTEAADRLANVAEALVPDLDALLLFEQDVSLSQEDARSFGVMHLWPDDWFRSFDQPSALERSALN